MSLISGNCKRQALKTTPWFYYNRSSGRDLSEDRTNSSNNHRVMRSISCSSERGSLMVLLRSYLLPVMENGNVEETIDGFIVSGPGYHLNVDEKQLALNYQDSNIEIALTKMNRTVFMYEIKNGSRADQMKVLAASRTAVSLDIVDKLESGNSALVFSEDLGDSLLLIEEQIKYKTAQPCRK